MGACDGFGDGAEGSEATAVALESGVENANDNIAAVVIAAEYVSRLREPEIAPRRHDFAIGRSARPATPRAGDHLAQWVERNRQLPEPGLSCLRKGFEWRSKAFRLRGTRFHAPDRGRTTPTNQVENRTPMSYRLRGPAAKLDCHRAGKTGQERAGENRPS